MQTEINCEIEDFSWEIILSKSQDFKQNPFNSRIFSLKNEADIAVIGENMSVHPENERTLNLVEEKLSQAVSGYYKKRTV